MKLVNEMENGMIVGIDIGKYNVQISCLAPGMEDAETLTTQIGTENYEIPMCLFQKPEQNGWSYGEKARGQMHESDGVFVDNLWDGALKDSELSLEDKTYSYQELMNIFMEKIWNLIYQCGYTKPIDCVVFTMENMNNEKIHVLRETAKSLPIDLKQVFYVDYKESFGVYATCRKKELWNHEVFLFYYQERCLKAFQLQVNQKTLPFRIKVGELDYGELEFGKEELEASEQARNEMDSRFLATMEELFSKKIVSTVYLIGDGFLASWMRDSLRMVCRGRRVFQGNNLFTKGACFAGEVYTKRRKAAGLFLSGQSMSHDVRIPACRQGEDTYLYAAHAGQPWYQAGITAECMVEGEEEIILEIVPSRYSENQTEQVEKLELSGFPKRPRHASKIRICVEFQDVSRGHIVVEDLGLGEFYASSGKKWEKHFAMQIKEEPV